MSPVSHGVCNVIKRVAIIGTSVLFFGNKLTLKTQVGTVIALIGTYLYTEMTKRNKVRLQSIVGTCSRVGTLISSP